MIGKILIFVVFFITAFRFPVNAQDEPLTRLPLMSALCIPEGSTGFNWKNRRWTQANFRLDDKYIVRKIDINKYRTSADRSKSDLFLCGDPSLLDLTAKGKAFSGLIDACYEIKQMGREAIPAIESRMCTESWDDGKLLRVSCEKHDGPLFFQPDGGFIRYPMHANIDKNTDTKDSLAIDVGSCSRIN